MYSKKLLTMVLAIIFIIAFTSTAFGEFQTLRQDREMDETEDHPWGGESPDPGGDDAMKATTYFYGTPLYFVDLIRVVVFYDFSNSTNPGTQFDDSGMLPDDMGNTSNGNHQKGQ